jgi:GTPase
MRLPVIAIVGRPNVGKSTLFNRLTGSRNALVSDFPGMTRDRQYGEADIADRKFIIIDTGGLTDEKEPMDQLTVLQAVQAIEDSDKILFVVDGRAGLTAQDQAIAEKLRTFNKPVTLVVNKTEGLDCSVSLVDFHRLGFGHPVPIAAAHGTGITALMIFVIPSQITDETIDLTETGIRFALVGRPNVGKSTLTNRMLGEERVIVYDQPGTTRDSIAIPFERHDKKYTLIDTAGIRRRGKIFETTEKFSVVKTLQAIESSQVVLFLMDAREGVTDQDLHLLGFILDSGKALVITYNKWDGLKPDEREKARATLDRRLNFISFARVTTISALHGTGVGNLFDFIDEAYQSACKKLSTPLLTKILQKALIQHSPPLVRGRRIKLRYAHAGGQNPPLIIIHGNQVDALPDAYKRYLAATYQQKLKLIGTPVKIEFKSSENPFRHHRNTLTPLQRHKKEKLMKQRGKKKIDKKKTTKKSS